MDWHTRYLQQAQWTAQLRRYLFDKAGLSTARNVLEVGCGTGALLAEMSARRGLYGLDLNLEVLKQARFHAPDARITCGNGERLPYADSVFDISYCHFVMLWVISPIDLLTEMKRVTRPGGAILALAEPDYGGRIDYPPDLSDLGIWQSQALIRQGADPEIGRKLSGLFMKAGLRQLEFGVLGGQWRGAVPDGENQLEWQVLEEDLFGEVPYEKIRKMQLLDNKARQNGERVLYVPTFYAWGLV